MAKSTSAPRTPSTPDALHDWIRQHTGVEIARSPLTSTGSAPFDYLLHTYFEGAPPGPARPAAPGRHRRHPPDCVVWANRGGGKTFLGALATLLDLLFKPGIEVRVLGGSLEQSQRMHEHLRRFLRHEALSRHLGRMTDRVITLRNGSRAQVLAQSQASVRGTRVQKVRCDEVELFDPEIWGAAQLTTRSMLLRGPWGRTVRGSVEALSTMHEPYGLMWNIVGDAEAPGGDAPAPPSPVLRRTGRAPRRLFRWGIVDTLGPCAPQRSCDQCALFPECAGRAKQRPPGSIAGHISIDDAIGLKSRVGAAAWEAEMLCLRPRRDACVLPEFDAAVHIGDWQAPPVPEATVFDPLRTERLGVLSARGGPARARHHVLWLAGMDFGFRSPTVVLLAWLDSEDVLRIEAEHIRTEQTLEAHIGAITAGFPVAGVPLPTPAWIGIDPAGNQRDIQSGVSAATVLRQAGFGVRSRSSHITDGLSLIRARLRPAHGGPRLLIHRRCTGLIESMHRYRYDPARPESMTPVKDGSDHAIDALRYVVLNLDRPAHARARRYA
jgi:hypothetical protein